MGLNALWKAADRRYSSKRQRAAQPLRPGGSNRSRLVLRLVRAGAIVLPARAGDLHPAFAAQNADEPADGKWYEIARLPNPGFPAETWWGGTPMASTGSKDGSSKWLSAVALA